MLNRVVLFGVLVSLTAAQNIGNLCEGQSTTISCPNGFINVQSASYGRTDANICPGTATTPIADTTCVSPNAQAVVQNLCQGQTTCVVTANNTVFNDPCVGTPKYLNVQYTCTTDAYISPPPICEGGSVTLDCGNGVLDIVSANYGRNNQIFCSLNIAPERLATTTCSVDALAVLQRLCQGRSTCVLDSNNYLYGDPCPNIYKYLSFKYRCIAPRLPPPPPPPPIIPIEPPIHPIEPPVVYDPHIITACTLTPLKLVCPLKKKLHIVDVFYGRKDKGICSKFALGLIGKCDGSYAAYPKVQSLCEGKPLCVILVKDILLGKKCNSLHFPYLTVSYVCL